MHRFCKSYFNVGLMTENYCQPFNVQYGIEVVKVESNKLYKLNYINIEPIFLVKISNRYYVLLFPKE